MVSITNCSTEKPKNLQNESLREARARNEQILNRKNTIKQDPVISEGDLKVGVCKI